MDWDFEAFTFDDADSESESEKGSSPAAPLQSVKPHHRYGHRQLARKLTSEAALSNALDWFFQEGDCYHCFSFGDVDSLTYVKHVLHQQRILYLAIST